MLLNGFEQAPAAISVTDRPEHRFVSANAFYRAIVGERPMLGRTFAEAFPEHLSQGFVELPDGVYRSGEPHVGRDVFVQWNRDGEPASGYFDFVYQPLTNANGEVHGILTHAVQIRQRGEHDLPSAGAAT